MAYVSHNPCVSMCNSTWLIIARKEGVYTKLLRSMLDQLEAMLTYHNKVHLLRFDLHQPDFNENSERISVFIRRLSGKIKTKYKVKRVAYTWVREQENVPNQHYHFVLMLDGNKIQQSHYILDMVRDTWEHMDGKHWVPENSYYNLIRGDDRVLQNAIFRISYLAKAKGKDKRPLQAKSYSTSRIGFRKAKKNTTEKHLYDAPSLASKRCLAV